jgi:hypothetical protein
LLLVPLLLELAEEVLEAVGDRLLQEFVIHSPQIVADAGLNGPVQTGFGCLVRVG